MPRDISKTDIPRNAMGWPVIEPKFMNEYQLRVEGEKWRKTALDTCTGTVGCDHWEKYAKELVERGFVEIVDPRIPLWNPDPRDPRSLYSGLEGRKIIN